MNFELLILRRAENDVEGIYRWLAKHSPAGAARWRETYVAAIKDLIQNPFGFGFAEEASLARAQVR
ncbi:MAG TPA: hypothetical protein VGY55_16175 [Pirellulales bacterium]|jgi:plasmid stabilization system protein ParE|nr:hypothetical protein [Pirellulales bacterium]